MTKVIRPWPLFSFSAKKKFTKDREFGFQRFGNSRYGYEMVGIPFRPFGIIPFGRAQYGDYFLLSGIYASRLCKEGKITIREKYYIPKDPRDPVVLSNREKFCSAVIGWQAMYGISRFGHSYYGDNILLGWLGLTLAEQMCYNKRANQKHMMGQNLFIRNYMSSN